MIIVIPKTIIAGLIIAGIRKTADTQMTTDMLETIKIKENTETKETMTKIVMDNINSNYETNKKESAIIALSFLFRNLSFAYHQRK